MKTFRNVIYFLTAFVAYFLIKYMILYGHPNMTWTIENMIVAMILALVWPFSLPIIGFAFLINQTDFSAPAPF